MKIRLVATILMGALCLGGFSASAMIMTGEGNAPVTDMGWPAGSLAVANLKTRAGWWEGPPFGGGEWHFLFRGDNAAFNDALTNFAVIRARSLELVLHDGPPEESPFLKDSKTVNWTFTVWVPENWHRLYNNPKSVFIAESPNFRREVSPPRLDVYVGAGGIDWSKVTVPANVHLMDDRTSTMAPNQTGGLVRVEAFDMANSKPINGARVLIASMNNGSQGVTSKPALRAGQSDDYPTVAEGTTDDSGRAEVVKIPGGPYRILIEAPGYAQRVLGYEQFAEHTLKSYSTDLSKTASVRGTAVDGEGKPVAGVKIRADSTMGIDGRGYTLLAHPEVTTDASGAFTIEGLPTGFCHLWASAEGFSFSDVTTIQEIPATNVVVNVKRAGGIVVHVTDRQGNALARFESSELMVFIEPKGGPKVGSWGGGFAVKQDGTVDMKNVPPGEYRISSKPNPANSNKEYTKDQFVEVKPGVTANVKFTYE